MDVRIGAAPDGEAAGFNMRDTCPLLLIGDVGRGKTTTARYLARWWRADTSRHVHVYAQAPSEWADLPVQLQHVDQLKQPNGRSCRPGICLVVIDGIDMLDDVRLSRLPRATSSILTSHGGSSLVGRTLPGPHLRCLGLVRPALADSADVAVLDGQGRLDWPSGTVAVIPDQRGPMDFPCHRWEAPANRWRATTP